MFLIRSQDFEKTAISLPNIARNLDASDVAGFFTSEEPIGIRIKNAVIDKLEDRAQDIIHNELDPDKSNIRYSQPKLKIRKQEKFKFRKLSGIIPPSLYKPLAEIGISSEERHILEGKVRGFAKHEIKNELYGKNDEDKLRNAKSSISQYGRSGSENIVQNGQDRKTISFSGKHGLGGQQIFLS